eukprot:9042695-Pyramimonas_sp.AAC.1
MIFARLEFQGMSAWAESRSLGISRVFPSPFGPCSVPGETVRATVRPPFWLMWAEIFGRRTKFGALGTGMTGPASNAVRL